MLRIQYITHFLHSSVGALRLLYTAALLGVVITAGCEGPLGPVNPSLTHITVVYLPFVESVEAPASVKVGETTTLTLSLSAEASPALLSDGGFELRTSLAETIFPDPTLPDLPASGFVWYLYIGKSSDLLGEARTSPPGSKLDIPVKASEAGTIVLYIAGAPSRALGGSATEFAFNQGDPVFRPYPTAFDFRMVTIEVTE
jgi:hypothetical protein